MTCLHSVVAARRPTCWCWPVSPTHIFWSHHWSKNTKPVLSRPKYLGTHHLYICLNLILGSLVYVSHSYLLLSVSVRVSLLFHGYELLTDSVGSTHFYGLSSSTVNHQRVPVSATRSQCLFLCTGTVSQAICVCLCRYTDTHVCVCVCVWHRDWTGGKGGGSADNAGDWGGGGGGGAELILCGVNRRGSPRTRDQ